MTFVVSHEMPIAIFHLFKLRFNTNFSLAYDGILSILLTIAVSRDVAFGRPAGFGEDEITRYFVKTVGKHERIQKRGAPEEGPR